MKCVKCGGALEEGIESSPRGGVAMWGTLGGGQVTKFLTGGGVLQNQRTITSYRCTKCGYLESYAK